MRIAIYWEQESWGGVDSHLLELLPNWPTLGDEFVLFYNDGNQGFERIRPELEKLHNVRCIAVLSCSHNELARRLKGVPGYSALRYILYFFQPITFMLMVSRLSRLFAKTGDFNLLLADNGGYPAAWGCLSALLAAKRAGIRSRVLLVHHAATRPAPFMGWFEHIVDRMVSSIASAVVCVSHATRQSLLDRRMLNPDRLRLRVIHNGISPTPMAADGAARTTDLRSVVDATDELLIGIVGRVEAYKGHEDIILALARLEADRRRRLRLVVIGSGDEDEVARLRRLADRFAIGDRVNFLGYLSGRPADLIAQFDLLVVATRSFEGFGLTLAEAMHVGTPVLATRIGAIPEFVDESTGMLVNPCSPGEIAVALNDFLENPDAWRRRAGCAQGRIRGMGDRMTHEYHRLFVECIAAQ